MAVYLVQPGATAESLPSSSIPGIGTERTPLTQNTLGRVFYTNQSGASSDYQKYLFGQPIKIDHLNEPTHLSFSLVPYDSGFVKLQRGAYIIVFTSTYGYWYSGYITNEPQLEWLGTTKLGGVDTKIWGYKYEAVSDEYLLNLNPVGVVPPFINTTQGAIIKSLATMLCPGVFNLLNIQDGQPVARYVVDPKAHFSDIVKDFSDQSAFRFWSRMKSLNFVPYDFNSSPITIDGSDKHFTPENLSISMVDEQVVNDVIVLGDIEPQTYMTEFFVGDGSTGSYPLGSSVYGVDSTIILQDDFSSSTIDTSKWTLFSTTRDYIQVANGYVNVLGGDGTGAYGTYLQSANLIPLEGHIRLTHGEWDFVSASSGVIGGLWTQPPNSVFTGCVYGLAVSKSGSNTVLNPIANGVIDNTQSMVIDYTKRYVMRTLFFAKRAHRFNHGWGFVKQDGTTGRVTKTTQIDSAYINTSITAIDPLTGAISPSITFTHTNVSLSALQATGYYIPVADDDLHCTFTQVTISTPLQARLDTRVNGSYSYIPSLVGPNELDTLDGKAPVATIVDANTGVTTRSSLLGTVQYNSGAAILQYFKDSVNLVATLPQKGDLVALSYRRPGAAVAHVQNQALITSEAAAWGDNGIRTATVSGMTPLPRNTDEAEQLGSAVLQDAGYQHFEGSYKQWSQFSFTSEPMAGMMVKFANLPSPPFFSNLQAELITEVKSTFSSLASGERFEHEFNFGKISRTKQILGKLEKPDGVFVPQDTVELPAYVDYKQIGTAFVSDITTSPTLFQFLGGNVLPNADFELLGQWWKISAVASTTSSFANIPVNAHSGNSYLELGSTSGASGALIQAQAATDSNSTTQCFYPVTQGDVLTFGGWINNIAGTSGVIELIAYNSSKSLVSTNATSGATAGSGWTFVSATYTVPSGVSYVTPMCAINGPATNPSTTRFDGVFCTNPSRIYIGINANPPSGGGFQVRYTDESWGCDSARNLLITTADSVIAVPRNARGKFVFIRPFDVRNKVIWSEDFTQGWIPGSGVTITNSTQRNPDNDISSISNIVWNNTVNDFVIQTTTTAAASTQCVFTLSTKAPVGNQYRLVLQDGAGTQLATATFTGNGAWQRQSVTGTFSSGATGNIKVALFRVTSGAWTIRATRASLETGVATESIYCKTLGVIFGATSRFSSGVRINHPLIPPAPTATVTYLNPASPVISVVLPASLSDVWGTEIRASDNSTVLYHKDLVDANYLPQFTDTVTLNRNLSYFIYTYNLLGEYSSGYNFTFSIPNNASGSLGTGKNGLLNPNFESDKIITPYYIDTSGVTNKLASSIGSYVADGWYIWDNSNMTAALDRWVANGAVKNGSASMLIRLPSGVSVPNGGQAFMRLASEAIPATPGKYYYIAGNIRTDGTFGAASVNARLSLLFLTATGTLISQTTTVLITTSTGAYIFKDVKDIAPANTAFVQATLELFYINSSGGTIVSNQIDARFDDLFFAQSTDPTFADVLTNGSIPPALSGGFTYTANDSSITWSWSNLTILKADGSSINLGSNSQAVTGLSASTTYFFYPYYDELTGQLVWLLFTGGTGSPAIAYVTRTNTLTQQQMLQSRIPLSSGSLSAATAASGGSNSGGGGGSGGVCLRSNMLVCHKDKGFIPISDCKIGDYIRSKNNRWTRIVDLAKYRQDIWIRITLPDGNYLDCTPSHAFTLPSGNKRAFEISLGDLMYTAQYADVISEGVSAIKSIEVIMEEGARVMIECLYDNSSDEEGHLFYAGANAPTILTHNPVLPCQ